MADVGAAPWGITEEVVRGRAPAETFRRGDEYERGGAVLTLVRRVGKLVAHVTGGRPAPDRVRIALDAAGVPSAACTCPDEFRG